MRSADICFRLSLLSCLCHAAAPGRCLSALGLHHWNIAQLRRPLAVCGCLLELRCRARPRLPSRPRHPGARNGKRFVQGKAGPIVFRVGMFGYVRLPYVRYFCWSLARPQMLPDRGLPIFVGRLLSTPGPRFCVAKSGAGLRVGFPLYMTPRARSDTRFLRYALTD